MNAVTRILVAGDANLDLVLRGDVAPRFGQAEQLLDAADLVLGSSAGICASGLARLGVPTTLCARIGDDLFGRRTRALLVENGVDDAELAVTDDRPTALSVILSAPDDRAILTLGGAMTALTPADVVAAVERFGATHVHLAAVFLLPALRAGLPELLAALQRQGVTCSLDTNWDPAEQWDGIVDCLPSLDVLLPNEAEVLALSACCGVRTTDPVTAAHALSQCGPTVAVKAGAAGGFVVGEGCVLHATPPVVSVVDTTGAGDSFDAGFLSAWTSGVDLDRCLRAAVTAGALSTRGPGGTGAQPTAAELAEAVA